jgi:hypothetical protein
MLAFVSANLPKSSFHSRVSHTAQVGTARTSDKGAILAGRTAVSRFDGVPHAVR